MSVVCSLNNVSARNEGFFLPDNNKRIYSGHVRLQQFQPRTKRVSLNLGLYMNGILLLNSLQQLFTITRVKHAVKQQF